ncbi:hypothetical protein LL364_004059 [Citrobacter freundii]
MRANLKLEGGFHIENAISEMKVFCGFISWAICVAIGRLIFMPGDGAFTPPKGVTGELIYRDVIALSVSR